MKGHPKEHGGGFKPTRSTSRPPTLATYLTCIEKESCRSATVFTREISSRGNRKWPWSIISQSGNQFDEAYDRRIRHDGTLSLSNSDSLQLDLVQIRKGSEKRRSLREKSFSPSSHRRCLPTTFFGGQHITASTLAFLSCCVFDHAAALRR